MNQLVKICESNVLYLASGSPMLFFDGYEDGKVRCSWTDHDGYLHTDLFVPETLRRGVPFKYGDY